MTLPSIPHQPLPANSTVYFPFVQNKRLRKNHSGASKFKRGGQPGNQNARKLGTFSTFRPGPFSPTRALIQDLRIRLNDPASPLDQIVKQARTAENKLLLCTQKLENPMDIVPVSRLFCELINFIAHAASYCVPYKRLSNALTTIAHGPFSWFERGYRDSHISRDADSFFPVSEKSAQYSPLPPCHPLLATNLTDSQWAVLAPLIPPDPHLDWLTGEPPTIIAANRWGFTQYFYTSLSNDMVVMENYYKILQRCPGLITPSPVASPAKKCGRPRTSPRALLDAIIWKLATGHNWEALPLGFPPMRVCRNYYRRLFLSGRLYTLFLALYNHLRLEGSTDFPTLLKAGVFTTTPSQKIALSPDASPTWKNYTALLFMQLARSAYTRLHRQHKQANPISLPLLPVFQGTAALSTGIIPGQSPAGGSVLVSCQAHLVKSAQIANQPKVSTHLSKLAGFRDRGTSRIIEEGWPEEGFQPLELSPAWSKWRKIEQDQKTITDEALKRFRCLPP